jgi:Mg2+-importing ATPase
MMTPQEIAALDVAGALAAQGVTVGGLGEAEVASRLASFGPNEPAAKRRRGPLGEFLSKFANPLVIVLLVIAVLSFAIGERVSGGLIMTMIFISVTVSFFQEYRSGRAAERLIEMVRTTATVRRGGVAVELALRDLVPGDIVELNAGDVIPADLRFIECKDLHVNQSAMTGESMPSEKVCGASQGDDLPNLAYMGTSVVSGTALGLVYATGAATRFGAIAKELSARRPPTSFDRGIAAFASLMIKAMLVMVAVIFAVNALFKGNLLETLMFSLAVAVGLTPEMLPTIVAVNLAKGAAVMAKRKVIVKHLNAIQNFGAMDVLCTDKTGTLTLDEVVLMHHYDVLGAEDDEVLKFAALNSVMDAGLKNLLDRAVTAKASSLDLSGWRKIDEIPFDFTRRVMSVVVEAPDGKRWLITKGAPESIMERCAGYYCAGERCDLEADRREEFRARIEHLGGEGFRVLALAVRELPRDDRAYEPVDEAGLILRGYLAFLDPPKPSSRGAIDQFEALGIRVIILTGDSGAVTKKICSDVGLNGADGEVVTGEKLDLLTDEELSDLAERTAMFARLNPLQKERVIKLLQKRGHTVGYLGDGINDAASLKTADVGISVNNAVDIAKESAELILLEKDLSVLIDGIVEGRRTFGNIIKFVRMGASSNFGNMLSLTGASLFLPFVPLAPAQVLLNNFLYDLTQISIPTDNVDKEYTEKPRPWNIAGIRRFMLMIGPVSSIFDFTTFALAIFVFHAEVALFRTMWFTESLMTQTLIIFIIRTGKLPFVESRPSLFLAGACLAIVAFGLILPFTALGAKFGFVPLPWPWFVALAGIMAAYVVLTELAKRHYVKRYGLD